MRIIDKAIKHWKATQGDRKSLDVPEWEATIWWSPWTLGEQDDVVGDGGEFRPGSFARIVVVKAQDESGKRLFAGVEAIELLNEVDPEIVKRVGGAIMADLTRVHVAAKEGEPEKN